MHVSKDITGSRGNSLAGRKIVLCLTGSVAVLRIIELARQLMRLGADVFPVMSRAACRLITPAFVNWATGNEVVTRITGKLEHVMLAGHVAGKADLVLIAPATANTISKVACGIDDTPVTTVATTALGEGIPLIIVPAMHESMARHPVVKENICRLKNLGVLFVDPCAAEGKAKMADPGVIIGEITRLLSAPVLPCKQKILITAGPTLEYIDPVRIITNKSSGKMGIALAEYALRKGAAVTIVYGPGRAIPPAGAMVINVETAGQMYEAVERELKTQTYDVVIAAAAVGDWTAGEKAERKIPTEGVKDLTLHLTPTVKIIDRVKALAPGTLLVVFRAVTGLKDEELINDGIARMEKARADYVVVNDVTRKGAGFDGDTNEVFIIGKDRQAIHIPLTTKQKIAEMIFHTIYKDKEKPCTGN